MRRSALGLALLAAACGAPDHQNPFDPATAPALQARATLAGTVALEPRGATPAPLAGVDVSVPGVGSVTTDAAGAWSLPGVPPGTHGVLFRRAGWDDATLGGVVVTLDDGDRTVSVPPVRLVLSRGHVTGTASLTAGAVAGFPVGADLSGTVVTLEATGEPTRTAVTDATGQYRFEAVPASLPGTLYVLTGRRPFFAGPSQTVAAVANETAVAPGLTLEVAAGALSGLAVATNVIGGGDAVDSSGIFVEVSGTAFNGAPWTTTAPTGVGGAWSTGALPPGTYDVVATVAGRACEPYASRAVEGGAAADAGTVLCLDRIAPGALALGAPVAPPGAQPGHTPSTTVTVPVSAQATDATVPSNLAGYETTVGAGADFSAATFTAGAPPSLDVAGLAPNARNVLWARSVDTAGNTGVPVAVEVVHDDVAPPTPALTTPRAIVAATTTSVTLAGSESDATFHHYEVCTQAVDALAACPAAPSCIFASSPASAAVSLAADLRTCLYARAVDAAGNQSGTSVLSVVSDLTPPPVPALSPTFDPTKLTVRADYVDFFVTAAPVDAPAGQAAWDKIAWLEADSGAGFEAICPQPACRAGDVWRPCGCGCTDPRLLCRGTAFAGIRMPLLGGLANQLNVRALDVAGNYGAGIGQKVITAGLEGFIAANGALNEAVPRLRGRLLTYLQGFDFTLVDLGANARHDATDTRCVLGTRGAYAPSPSAEAASPTLVVHASGGSNDLAIRRAGADGVFCTPDDATSVIYTFGVANAFISTVAASGERAAWVDQVNWPSLSSTLRLREPGPDGLLGTADDTSAVITTGAALVSEVLLAPGVLAYRVGDVAWVVLADPVTRSFAGKVPQQLASGAAAVALSADGTRIALATATGLTVRTPGADRVYLTADDGLATRPLPGGTILPGALTVEGAHLVAMEWGGGQIVHWYAGGNETFETSGGDDTVSRLLPSASNRYHPSLGSGLSAGYLVYQVNALGLLQEQPDVLSLDLTGLRWEVVGVGGSPTVRTNGNGVLLYGAFGTLQARTSDGRTSGVRLVTPAFDVYGDDLVEVLNTGLVVSGPGPNGLWFDADDVQRASLHAGTFSNVVVKEGKAAAFRLEGTVYVPYVYDQDPLAGPPAPGAGPVSTFKPVLVDGGGTPQATPAFFQNLAVTQRHVFWSCGTVANSPDLCYRWAGPDGTFGTADDGPVVSPLPRPSNAAPGYPGLPYWGILGVRASGDRVVILDNNFGAILLDPGADRAFGTADDFETVLGNRVFDRTLVDISGDWLATSAAGDFPGEQITIWDLARGGSRQVTSTYSGKDALALEPSGRLFWHDAIFSEGAVFVFAP